MEVGGGIETPDGCPSFELRRSLFTDFSILKSNYNLFKCTRTGQGCSLRAPGVTIDLQWRQSRRAPPS